LQLFYCLQHSAHAEDVRFRRAIAVTSRASNAHPAADASCVVASQPGRYRDDEGERIGGSSAGDGLLDSWKTKKQEAINGSQMWFILARQRGCPLPTRLIRRKSKKSQRKYYGAQEL
jgi:hypothetical protein